MYRHKLNDIDVIQINVVHMKFFHRKKEEYIFHINLDFQFKK